MQTPFIYSSKVFDYAAYICGHNDRTSFLRSRKEITDIISLRQQEIAIAILGRHINREGLLTVLNSDNYDNDYADELNLGNYLVPLLHHLTAEKIWELPKMVWENSYEQLRINMLSSFTLPSVTAEIGRVGLISGRTIYLAFGYPLPSEGSGKPYFWEYISDIVTRGVWYYFIKYYLAQESGFEGDPAWLKSFGLALMHCFCKTSSLTRDITSEEDLKGRDPTAYVIYHDLMQLSPSSWLKFINPSKVYWKGYRQQNAENAR